MRKTDTDSTTAAGTTSATGSIDSLDYKDVAERQLLL
jgi:hypothetical protein